MIEVEVHRRPQGRRWDRRGLLFDATALYNGLRFEVHGHQPVVAALRAVINGAPDFTDCPWQLVRDGRVDLSGPSARKMAGCYVAEDGRGTRLKRDRECEIGAIYAPSATSGGEAA